MVTSNWQNIPFCVEALMMIEPMRALDVGVGFGRWGIIVREFCEVWFGRALRKDWKIHLEGIEAFAESITDYHHSFYDKIHVGDARKLLPALLEQQWDVVIFGDVIEHFEKAEGVDAITRAIQSASYVLVNVPLGSAWSQAAKHGNPHERHLSQWTTEDLRAFPVRQEAFFRDYIGRPFGSFVLAGSDPKGLRESLFLGAAIPYSEAAGQPLTPMQQELLTRTQQIACELNAIKSSYTWRFGRTIAFSPLGRVALRMVHVAGRAGSAVGKPWSGSRARGSTRAVTAGPATVPEAGAAAQFSEEEERWLEEVRAAAPPAIAVSMPGWRGVRASTAQLFPAHRLVDDTLDEQKAQRLARLLCEAGCERVVLSGFALSYRYLVASLREIGPQVKVYVLWHGNFLYSCEDYTWQAFRTIEELYKDGLIYRWGFVKKGMAEVMARRGFRTGFVLNYVGKVPEGPSVPLEGGPHIGIWGSPSLWKKLLYAMLASTLLIPGSIAHVWEADARVSEFAQTMGIDGVLHPVAVPHDQMSSILAQMGANLYVTMSECAPMLPLESLSVGAPCLLGPNSHLFEDHQYLHELLVVPYPDRAEVIAEHAVRALEERDEIIQAYKEYAPGYNERALQTLAEFLEL